MARVSAAGADEESPAATATAATKEKKLIYSFVARGMVILAEHAEFAGNFADVAKGSIDKLTAADERSFFAIDGYTFNFLVQDGYTYCVVGEEESAGKRLPFAFLDRVKGDFHRRYGRGRAATASADSLNRAFGPKLREHMRYCSEHPEKTCRIAKAQLAQVKEIMVENISKVADRGEKLVIIVDKTRALHDEAQGLKRIGERTRRAMWVQNMKLKLIVLGIVIALALIIVLSVCNGFNCR